MNEEQKIEFTNLKYIRAERGFWTPDEKERWDFLISLNRYSLKEKLKKFDKIMDEVRMSKLN